MPRLIIRGAMAPKPLPESKPDEGLPGQFPPPQPIKWPEFGKRRWQSASDYPSGQSWNW